jgi:hypothetical protein
MDDGAPTLSSRRVIEPGVADEGAVRTFDDPDVIGERNHLIVRVAEDVVLRTHARLLGVTHGIDLVDVVAHR